jgi:hypothetical protein
MKNTLNEILYKLAESELNNSDINEQSSNIWQRIKNKFKRDKYDYNTATTSNQDPSDTHDDVVINYFAIDPPMINATINSKWGELRPNGRHKGIDMRTTVGTPVYTVRPGTVVYIGDNPTGWGNYIIIKHELSTTAGGSMGETFYSLYAHLAIINVSTNETVDFGTVIGKSGGGKGTPGAGNSRGPHLHFEIKTKQNGGSIDPVKFYAKYKQKLEHAQLHTSDYEDTNQADYIVNPADDIKGISKIETPIASIAKDKIIPGVTELDGFYVYELPKDTTYLYGVPTPNRTDLNYGWWFVNSYDSVPTWKYLKSRLSPANYSIATAKLDAIYPNAIDRNKLATTEIPQRQRDTTTTKKNNEPKPVKRDSNKKIFSLLVPGHAYISTSVLKRKPKYKLYTIDPQTKKLVYTVNATIADVDNIVYIGHDTSNQYMHMQVVEPGINPGNANKYWISVNDIELKK